MEGREPTSKGDGRDEWGTEREGKGIPRPQSLGG